MTFYLFPSDPLGRGLTVDPAFERLFKLVQDAGEAIGFVNYEKLLNNDEKFLFIPKFVEPTGSSEYHGWMLDKRHYQMLSDALERLQTPLRTTVKQYETAHYATGWVDALRGLIPETIVVPHEEIASIADYASQLETDTFFVKDFIKSVPGVTKAVGLTGEHGLPTVAKKVIEERGELYAGGLLLRPWVEPSKDAVEIRAWWREGEFIAFTPHPNTPGEVPEVPKELMIEASKRLNNLKLKFVTVDFMETPTGWLVVEVGDAQVSEVSNCVSDKIVQHILNVN